MAMRGACIGYIEATAQLPFGASDRAGVSDAPMCFVISVWGVATDHGTKFDPLVRLDGCATANIQCSAGIDQSGPNLDGLRDDSSLPSWRDPMDGLEN